jgi:two-component system, NarL family, sensor kinase
MACEVLFLPVRDVHLNQRKLDAETFLSQTLIWFLLISYVVVVYVVVVAIGTLPYYIPTVDFSPPWWLNLLALLVIAATFLPVYRWVRASVRELIYSQQENPYLALTQLNQYLESSPSPHDILPTIVKTIAHTLKLPFVEIEIRIRDTKQIDEPMIIAYGKQVKGAALERVSLSFHNTSIGEMRVSGRRYDEALSSSDLSMLHDLAQQVGITLYATQLTEDLQHARERLVIAREEERRRIRNDLHDGLAPTLSSMQLQLGVIRNLMHQNPEKAGGMISDLREDMRNATAEIRQLVYDLRPPMLDELGLVGAMRNSKYLGSEVRMDIHAPDPMPKLPAAVEVAVYRIASEALHNVVKHAQATDCEVWINLDGGCLILKVIDNGKCLPSDIQAGVGLSSMKERAAELGGTLIIQPNEPTGTCVLARIPIETGCMEV